VLLRARNSQTMAKPLSALHMKAADLCEILVKYPLDDDYFHCFNAV